MIPLHQLPIMFYRGFVRDSARLYRILPPELKVRYWLVLGLQILTALTETFTLLVISLFALTIAAPDAAPSHFLIRPFLNYFPKLAEIVANPRSMVILTSSLMIFFVAIKCVLTIYASHRATVQAQRMSLELSGQALASYLASDFEEHLKTETQNVIHLITNRDRVGLFFLNNLFLYANAFSCLTLFVSLAVIEPKLTLIVVVAFGLAALTVYGLVKKQLDAFSQKVQQDHVKEGRDLLALNQGVREILIYGRQKTALKRFFALGQGSVKARAFVYFCSTIPSQALEAVGFGTIGLMVVSLILYNLPLADIVASTSILMLTAWRILPAVSRCLSFAVSVRSLRPQAIALLELVENKVAQPLAPPDPNFTFEKEISLDNVTFTYPSGDQPAVQDLSLTIQKGQSVGLIGLSGSGKTTVALLLSGLVTPKAGRFLVDGETLTPAKRAAYFKILGYVPQNPLLLEGTLAENVAFSQWGETFDRDRVFKVCQEAALDFAVSRKEGLDQLLAPSSLSGGQAQRTAIARALYPNPKIVIFDEATSALDQASENIIKNTLERFQGRLTSIIIAHRLATVEKCDLLVWVDAGSIKLSGPPAIVIPEYEKALAALTQLNLKN
ncbi:MAG: ABC transporter ATP-binding protein/permease [Deltaproteobacteria bacterium]|jgi:ABC-type multidrug transport system fused ATPase/permease subunit|nr:ABC transporter ATP-binding protein/permease [Deltaproteobacteria bacterium]